MLVENSVLAPAVLGLIAVVCVGVTLVPTSGRVFAVCTLQFSLPTFGTVANVALFFPAVFFATLTTITNERIGFTNV